MIYFDYAATTPMSNEAISAYTEAARLCIGNESSLHDEGSKAKHVVEVSRQLIADAFRIDSQSVIFTSGGTESNQIAIRTLLKNCAPHKKQIICSSIEHSSVNNELILLEKEGYEIKYLRHLEDGTICLQHLQQLVNENTSIVIIQHVNSEIGIIQPLEKVYKIIKGKELFLHVDCVQSFGKIDCSPIGKWADSIAISSHKVFGPKAVGAIVFPSIHNLRPINFSITHENGFRAGTVNVPGIYSFAIAVQQAQASLSHDYTIITRLRNRLLQLLHTSSSRLTIIQGKEGYQLPHIICLLCSKVQGQYVMMELNQLGYAISSGSACQSGSKEPSKVLLTIGKDHNEAKSSIRISLGKYTTEEQCLKLAEDLLKIMKK
ncbi:MULTISPECIES: cysteine desulfurase family protein [Bacillus]|uniref:cysteine desulfurase family protein n=1 Tax=Bacillus TaxID=1386 RepID=UPI000318496E|nr:MULTISPECIES: IscS subfamily cysteine desulfurase [Bacillus]